MALRLSDVWALRWPLCGSPGSFHGHTLAAHPLAQHSIQEANRIP